MIITPKILGTGVVLSLGRRSAPWAMALAAGSIFLACSGTIDTPTDEYPTRSSNAAAADDQEDEDDDTQAANTTPRAPVVAPPADDDDDDAPAAPTDDDDDAPAAPPEEEVEEVPAAGGGGLAFEADVWPILNTTCGPCHAGSTFGGNDIGDTDVANAFDEATRVADRIIARVEGGTMPPACTGDPGSAGCMSVEDFDTVKSWVEAGTPE